MVERCDVVEPHVESGSSIFNQINVCSAPLQFQFWDILTGVSVGSKLLSNVVNVAIARLW